MILAPEEVEQFYRVWFPLLHFVNKQRRLVKSFPEQWGARSVAPEKAMELRNALWADDSLRKAFIEQNPANLSPEDLALVESWKYRLAGNFFVYRYLKKYTVFLSDGSPVRAYGVFGLVSPFEDLLGPYLPVYVKTVLLPFGDRIIYDSLIAPYPVIFGGGVRADLSHSYRQAEERQGIITSLQSGFEQPTGNPRRQQKKVLSAFQKELGRAGLSPKMITEHLGSIESFVQSGRFDSPVHTLLDFDGSDIDAYLGQPYANPVSLKRFLAFLRDTDRIDYGHALELLDALKKQRTES